MPYLRAAALIMSVLAAASLFVGCGDDDEESGDGGEATTRAAASPTDGGADGGAVTLELTAENTSYDPTELSAPPGAGVTITFDNDDDGVQHNFSLYETEESEDPLFEGPRITGVESVDYEFTAPADPGTYHFHCDVHPTQMTGDFVVE